MIGIPIVQKFCIKKLKSILSGHAFSIDINSFLILGGSDSELSASLNDSRKFLIIEKTNIERIELSPSAPISPNSHGNKLSNKF